jgi:hypothetical protein
MHNFATFFYLLLFVLATCSAHAAVGGGGAGGGHGGGGRGGGHGGLGGGQPGKYQDHGPWLTGPLLTPSGHAIPKGHYNIEPYLYITTNDGMYDSNWKRHKIPDFTQIVFQLSLQFGVWDKVDIKSTPQASYNIRSGQKTFRVNDLPIGFDIQLLMDSPDTWYPAIKFSFVETFPIGKYQKLNPDKKGTDLGGFGSFASTPGLVFSRLFHFGNGVHYLATRLSISYTLSAPVHVKGMNAYGGGPGTNGKVYPGNSLGTLLGLEYSMTQHWVLACDIANFYNNKTRFSGRTGGNAVGSPSNNQLSIAPALEYNWSENIGVIGGVWWTIAGRNATAFKSGVIALNYYR